MARCEVCGNEYDKTFEVSIGGETHLFDSFECAIHAVAPTCPHCGCKVVGHGVEAGGTVYWRALRTRIRRRGASRPGVREHSAQAAGTSGYGPSV
jgi:hypothetical protein